MKLAMARPHPRGGFYGVIYDVAEAVDVYTCPHRHRATWSRMGDDAATECARREIVRRARAARKKVDQ